MKFQGHQFRIGFLLFKKKGFHVFSTSNPNIWVWTMKEKRYRPKYYFIGFQKAFRFKSPKKSNEGF
jgi:hypothetical protein